MDKKKETESSLKFHILPCMVNVESTSLKVTHCKRDRTKICGYQLKKKKVL